MTRRPQAFVIMPFGNKLDADGRKIDFDAIYEQLIAPALVGPSMAQAGGPALDCVRCDQIAQAGWVHRQMIEYIHASEVVVVDLSTLNPNVFYELGVRHALRRSVTVLICREGTNTPFNLQGFKAIRYKANNEAGRAQARQEIARYVANGLRAAETDSLVHEVLNLGGAPRPIRADSPRFYQVPGIGNARRLCLLTGDLRNVTERIDLWVNSENTNMQMARFYDRAGSAMVRYLGAERDQAGRVTRDLIAEELAQAMGSQGWVPPGTVIVTGSGALTGRGVKRVLHVAAVEGHLGGGYRPVPDIALCVDMVLARADDATLDAFAPRSLLLPLLGTGSGGAPLHEAIGLLFDAMVGYFRRCSSSRLEIVYLQVFTEDQMVACERALALQMAVASDSAGAANRPS